MKYNVLNEENNEPHNANRLLPMRKPCARYAQTMRMIEDREENRENNKGTEKKEERREKREERRKKREERRERREKREE